MIGLAVLLIAVLGLVVASSIQDARPRRQSYRDARVESRRLVEIMRRR